MLDEWRPLMCPYDVTMGKAFIYFNIFLPTFNVLDHRDYRTSSAGYWLTCVRKC